MQTKSVALGSDDAMSGRFYLGTLGEGALILPSKMGCRSEWE